MVNGLIDTLGSLKATCPVKDLHSAVDTVRPAVSGRTSLPILSHILLSAEEGHLRIMATDLELGISCRIAANVAEGGALTAPAKTLAEVLANLPVKNHVDVSGDRSHTLHLHSDNSDYKILGLPSDEYPALPELKPSCSFTMPSALMREMIRQTLYAVSTDETRPNINGILLVLEDETIRMVGTDAHRLAHSTARITGATGSQSAIVPARAMTELNRQLTEGDGDVEVAMSSSQIQFALPGEAGVRIISRLREGQFPQYARIIPTSYTTRLTVPVAPLLRAVRGTAILAREDSKRIIFQTEADKLLVTNGQSLVGQAREEVEIVREGEDVQVGFNAAYLKDLLTVTNEEGIAIELTSPLKPVAIRPITAETEDSGRDYVCVVMPMSVEQV